jgi:hypothetical protein
VWLAALVGADEVVAVMVVVFSHLLSFFSRNLTELEWHVERRDPSYALCCGDKAA